MITKTWSLTVFLCLHGSKQLWEEVPEQVEMSTPNSKGFPPKNMQGFFWWMKHELKWVKYICDMSIWSYGLTHQFHSYWLVLCSSEKWTPWIITRLLATNLVIRSSTSSVGAPFVETTCPMPPWAASGWACSLTTAVY